MILVTFNKALNANIIALGKKKNPPRFHVDQRRGMINF